MLKRPSKKMKLLALAEILQQETDDEHGLTMPQIIEKLEERGISAERKALYNDLDVLRDFGFDIIIRKEKPPCYAIGKRDFEFPELLLLVDAVQSSRFLTDQKSSILVDKLKCFTSRHQAKLLDKHIYVEGRIKTQNESIYYNVDSIHEAIQTKRKVTFKYFKYDLEKKRRFRADKELYCENPIALVYVDEFYYLIAYNENHQSFVQYRVDRMLEINITDDAIIKNQEIADFNVQEYVSRAFRMFSGEKVNVELLVSSDIMSIVIDRFGKDVLSYKKDEDTARVHITVLKSNVFFGWLTQLGTKAKIESPTWLAQEYRDYLNEVAAQYK